MKKLILLLILAAGITACNKKDEDTPKSYTCPIHYEKIGGTLSFTGYSVGELDIIYVGRYKANTALLELEDLDTFVFNTVHYNTLSLKNDSIDLRSTSARQPELMEGSDYDIFIPRARTRYAITRIGYTPKPASGPSETPCNSGSRTSIAPDSCWINSTMVYTQDRTPTRWRNIVLNK